MPIRVPLQSVPVVRDGNRVEPKIGEPFDFTDEEVEHIEAANPDALSNQITVSAEQVEAGKPVKVGGSGKKAGAKNPENKGEDI